MWFNENLPELMNSPEPTTPEIRKNVRTWAKEHVLPLVPLGLLMLTAAIWFNGYSSGLRQDMQHMEQRLRQDMNEGFRNVNARLDDMDGSLADVRERLSALEARFEMNPAYSEWLDRPSTIPDGLRASVRRAPSAKRKSS